MVKKVKLRIEKLDILKNTSSVGIEIEKSKFNDSWKRKGNYKAKNSSS